MIKVEHIDVYGFEHAVRAMRNPMNSWDKSDSGYCGCIECDNCRYSSQPDMCNIPITFGNDYIAGDNDLDLMQRLYKSGTEHRTYARMIMVWMDITAPLYWWKEMDRYTVGKSQVSCSTMHKIADREFTIDDFSYEHLDPEGYGDNSLQFLDLIVETLNNCRELYLQNGKSKQYWWYLIQLLPTSYNQRRTVCMSYETVFKIIRERTGHKLDEWNEFVEILKGLPYVKEIMNGSET